ncbi:atp-binding cassette transporter [Moniliophthora roreri]|nr:atp-binding cassette transporter [Moniliophthora roreri]
MMDSLLDITSCVAVLSLVFLTINAVLSKNRQHDYTDTATPKDNPKSPTRTALQIIRSICLATLCVVQLLGNIWQASVYFYATILSLKRSSTTTSVHLELILLSALGVYAYRDIYPLVTYDLSPQDEWESPFIWVKIILLLLTSVVIPLVTPGVYVPVDPKNPMATPNPSQTASPLSMIFYSHLDPLVARAYKQVHLPANELPPLADDDMVKHLKAKHFKSTLALSLLRCIPIEGEVFYDNLPISNLNLDALRSRITIIPQSPELISGTLRQNLDPFGEHDDHMLNGALASAGLQSLQRDLAPEGCINLDTTIASGGSNLSMGQRQIIALARAIVRQSKLLILDEATSAIDYETDSIIQSSLRNDLGKDVTVITIAHRLQTVMDADKILVLDAGNMVEFDAPKNLLQKTDGYFKALVDQSHDKEDLLSAMK